MKRIVAVIAWYPGAHTSARFSPVLLRMDEVENDKLMHSHGVLKEVVSRCCRDFREKSNHAARLMKPLPVFHHYQSQP